MYICTNKDIYCRIKHTSYMGRLVKVRDGKGNILEMDESLLEGEPCTLTESEIKNLPRLDIQSYLDNGYITAEDYRKSLNQNGTF